MSALHGTINEDLQKADWGIGTTIIDDVDKLAVVTTQDVAPILEANNDDFNSGHNGNVRGGWGRHVARIPMNVVADWLTKYGVDALNRNHWGAVARLLNSNEYRYLRTAPGQIGLIAK